MNFYVIKPEGGLRFGTKWAYGEKAGKRHYGPAPRCPVCGRPVGMKEWLPPHYIKLSSAKPEKWGDFLWGTFSPFMVSRRFMSIYEREGLRGIAKFYPAAQVVRVGRRKRGELPPEVPEYHLVKVPWGKGLVDDAASGMVRKGDGCSYCLGTPIRYERIVLKEWSGEDVFTPRGVYGVIMVSERFKEVVERYGVTNVWLIPAECYGYDEKRQGLWYVREDCGDNREA